MFGDVDDGLNEVWIGEGRAGDDDFAVQIFRFDVHGNQFERPRRLRLKRSQSTPEPAASRMRKTMRGTKEGVRSGAAKESSGSGAGGMFFR